MLNLAAACEEDGKWAASPCPLASWGLDNDADNYETSKEDERSEGDGPRCYTLSKLEPPD